MERAAGEESDDTAGVLRSFAGVQRGRARAIASGKRPGLQPLPFRADRRSVEFG